MENKLVGKYAVLYEFRIDGATRPKKQMLIIDVIGNYVFVEYLDWASGNPMHCGLCTLKQIHEDDWTLYNSHAELLQHIKRRFPRFKKDNA